ncbi:MAG TPA: choice-of-anchor D domain-containing protein, partial [Acidobacteriaceae bacterium]
SQIVTAGDFTETDNCAGAIAVGAGCAVQVKFLPAAVGARSGMLTVYGNVAGGQATAKLSGTGAPAAAIILDPISVAYSATNVGAVSAAQNITVSNTGGVTATLQTPVVTGDFTIMANTCGATLAAGVGCTVSVAFQPTASGTRTGSFSLTDSTGIQTTSLTGTGLLPATDALAPASLTFAAQVLNTASMGQQVTLTNAGDAALTLVAAQIASGDFTVVNGCGNSLAAHSVCALTVVFVPKSVGAEVGVLTVSDQYRSQTVTLSGTGVAPAGVSVSPVGTMAFAATGVGLSAAPQTATLTNNGGMPLLIQSIGATGDFAVVAGSSTCGTSLAVGTSCSVQVVFAPAVAGTCSGSLVVVDNAPTSPQRVSLTGAGVDFALTANGSTTQTIATGGQAVYPLLLTSAAGQPGTVAFTCSPLPAHATCTVNPSPGAMGGTSTITVTVATSVAGAELRWPDARQMVWFAVLVPLWFGRRRLRRVGLAALVGCVLLVAGCSASRLIPVSGGGGGGAGNPTPSGTYNLTVTGTNAGLVRSVGLTLVVQ